MSGAQLHLLLNHIPVIGLPFCLLLLTAGMVLKDRRIQTLSMIFLVGVALVALPVYFSGEPAEKNVEGLPGVTENWIEAHEEAAEASLIVVSIAGVLALAGLVLFRKRDAYPVGYLWLLILPMVLGSAALAKTAHQGGLIRHTELRGSTVAVAQEHED